MTSSTAKSCLVVCLIALVIVQLGQWRVASSAQEQVRLAEERYASTKASCDKEGADLNTARERHHGYLAAVSNIEAEKLIFEATARLEQARKAKLPGEMRKFAAQVIDLCDRAASSLGAIQQEIAELDTALQSHTAEIKNLERSAATARATIDTLEKEGFFVRHFVESERLLSEAQKALASTRQSKNDGDYLSCYRVAREGTQLAQQGGAAAENVKESYINNDSGARELLADLDTATGNYVKAMAAADHLEQYRSYGCRAKVMAANAQLASCRALIDQCRERNGLGVQDFTGAARKLAQAQDVYQSALSEFNRAERLWADMRQAVGQLDSEKSAAESGISKAKKEINDWSENTQSRAESLLSEARSSLNEGNRLHDTDPIRAVGAFREAATSAQEAHDAVDTSTHHDDDSDWGSTGSPTSSGSPSSSGSGDSESSPGYSGGGGSSYDSGSSGSPSYDGGSSGSSGGGYGGPSGGGSGGPSGGGSGGPTGGGYGGGL